MKDTTINYMALAYCIFSGGLVQNALTKFQIRQHQDHAKQCRYFQYVEAVKDMIVNKKMRKIDVQRELNISREILDKALKYANVPKQDYRKVKHAK